MKCLAVTLWFFSALLSCDRKKSDDHTCVYPLPPPILNGTCVGESYVGSTPIKQTCVHADYKWSCTWHPVGNLYLCDRGARMESFAEKPPVK